MSKPINWSKPLQTRDGKKARLLGVVNRKSYSHVVAVELEDVEEILHYTPSGSYWNDGIVNSVNDLINVPERIKREVWVNVYPSCSRAMAGDLSTWYAREDADKYAAHDRLACVKVVIECEEGEGL